MIDLLQRRLDLQLEKVGGALATPIGTNRASIEALGGCQVQLSCHHGTIE